MSIPSRLGLTLPQPGEADWIDDVNSSNSVIQTKFDNVYKLPSGLPEGTARGRVVCLGPGTGGASTVFLAFANPPIGNEYRRRPFGITLQTAPAADQDILIQTIGFCPYDHAKASWNQTGLGTSGAVPSEIPEAPSFYGLPAYLKNGDIANANSLGHVTSDPLESLGYNNDPVIVGVYLPLNILLCRPRIQVEA